MGWDQGQDTWIYGFNPAFLTAFNREQAWHYRVLPKLSDVNSLVLLCDETENTGVLADELEISLGKSITLDLIPAAIITQLLNLHYPKKSGQHQFQKMTLAIEGDGFLNDLIREARSLQSSDIHIEIYEEHCRVRIRIDGMMVERYVLKKSEYLPLSEKNRCFSLYARRITTLDHEINHLIFCLGRLIS